MTTRAARTKWLIKRLYERGFSAEQIRQLYRLVDGMMSLPKPLAILAWKEIRDFAKEKSMPFITGADIVEREEALAEGMAKGREEGREEGRKEARELLLAAIEALLETKFAEPGLALVPEIPQIDDLSLLRKIIDTAKQAESPEIVRRLWANV